MRSLIPALLLLGACGGNEPAAAPTAAAPAGPALQCEALVEKIAACADVFAEAYAQTELAQRAGGGNGAQGAETFLVAFRHEHNRSMGHEICENDWSNRDPGWRERLAPCDPAADCEAFAACAAPAIGQPM